MSHRDNRTVIEAVMQLLETSGTQELAGAIQLLLNQAMVAERNVSRKMGQKG